MVTKSGTRDFRGTAYWQRRHEGMNANTFFNNRSNIQRPLYRYFIGGGTIGGPIYIPKVFNVEKQKLFFFWSEEFTRVAQPTQTSTANLPTVAERAGDFSDSRNAAGSVITIKDPTTGAPFAGNQIPLNRIDATGQKFLNLFLKPNGYVNPAPGQRYTANFLASATPYYRRRDDIVRIDYNPTSKMLVYGRWGHDLSDTLNVFTVSPGVGPLLNQLPGWNISTHVVNTISPTLVNDLNIGLGETLTYGCAPRVTRIRTIPGRRTSIRLRCGRSRPANCTSRTCRRPTTPAARSRIRGRSCRTHGSGSSRFHTQTTTAPIRCRTT
jgi:hypothetical protein